MSHDHCALLLVRMLPQEAPLLLLVRQSARSRRAAYSCFLLLFRLPIPYCYVTINGLEAQQYSRWMRFDE